MKFALTLMFALICMPAFAGNQITVTQLCQQLTDYQPDASVDYKAGLDAHGDAVMSADIDGTPQIALPDTTKIAITVDQAQMLGLPPTNGFRPEAYIGDVEVTKDHLVYFNGKRLSAPQVKMLCDKGLEKNKP